MNFSEDFVSIQGILVSAKNNVGDFLSIRHKGGNEQKISTVVDGLRSFLTEKKYLRKGKINSKYETKLREINFFLILNTEFANKRILASDNKFAHLIDVMPQLSKCLLANIVWNLDLCRFYSEAIYSVPVEISVELLENCNKCIKKQEPYLVLEQVAMIALAIYVKLFHIRNENIDEDKTNGLVTKLLEKFTEILQNYVTPEIEKMSTWAPAEMYQYLGVAINKVLHLLKCCFNIFLNNNIGEMHELYQVNTQGVGQTPEKLDKSAQALKKCNICLMSVCEANLQAVTVDVFCSWAEYKHNNTFVQQIIGALAYEVRQQLDHFEGCGNLPSMLDTIKIKPKSIEDVIREADEETLLRNVLISDINQPLWLNALLKHGVMKSKKIFETFKKLVHLLTKEDFLYLLSYSAPFIKDNQELKNYVLDNISKIGERNAIEIISEYFQKSSINNLYETDKFETQLNELFNKLCKGKSIFCAGKLPTNEIINLVLQNPTKFIVQLFLESLKNVDHLSNILKIIEYIKPVCSIRYERDEHTLLTITLTKFLNEYEFEPSSVQCLTIFVNSLVASNMLNEHFFNDLLETVVNLTTKDQLQRGTAILKIMQNWPSTLKTQSTCKYVLFKLVEILTSIRWTFVTFDSDKVQMASEIITLIKTFESSNIEDLEIETIKGNELNLFYLSGNKDFLISVSPGFSVNLKYEEQVCRILKLLPCCTPSEWLEVRNYMLICKSPTDIFNLFLDVFIILAEILKNEDYHPCLSYCFQQFCIHAQNDVYPYVQQHKEHFPEFIKNICRVIRYLPPGLQNNSEISLVNLCDQEILKYMTADQEFICLLMSISHLEISQIICSKMIQ